MTEKNDSKQIRSIIETVDLQWSNLMRDLIADNAKNNGLPLALVDHLYIISWAVNAAQKDRKS